MPYKNKSDLDEYNRMRRTRVEWKIKNLLYQQRYQERKRYIKWLMGLYDNLYSDNVGTM